MKATKAGRRRLVAIGVAAAALPIVLAACSSSSSDAGSASPAASGAASAAASAGGEIVVVKDDAIAATLPADIASKGSLTFASDVAYAPMEFFDVDGTTVIGVDADIAKAVGQVLGLDVTLQNMGFDSILPGLSTGKYDLGISAFSDTKEREKVVDFVDYFNAGTSFFVKADSGVTVNTLDDLCGLKVGVEKGTTMLDDATAQSEACTKAGKAAIDVQAFPDQNGANLALSSGRVDVSMADSTVAAYQVTQSNGQLALSGQPYGAVPFGIAMVKGSPMSASLQAAVQKLIDSGAYAAILKKWGVEEFGIPSATVNGAVS